MSEPEQEEQAPAENEDGAKDEENEEAHEAQQDSF
jgi:hypothetical protein